jgi:cell division protein FtsB
MSEQMITILITLLSAGGAWAFLQFVVGKLLNKPREDAEISMIRLEGELKIAGTWKEYAEKLEQRIAVLDEKIVELEKRVKVLNKENEELVRQMARLVKQNQQLIDDNKRLHQENAKLSKENEQLKRRIAELEKKFKEYGK